MAETTANFGWSMPDQDTGTNWDATLNDTTFAAIDTDVDAIKTTADAAMPKAGGVFTGEIEVESSIHATVDKGSVSGAQTLDLDNADHFYATATGAITWTISNWPASGKLQYVFLELTNGGAGTQTFPGGLTWDGGSAPTFQSSGVDVIVMYSRDNGTTIHAKVVISHT